MVLKMSEEPKGASIVGILLLLAGVSLLALGASQLLELPQVTDLISGLPPDAKNVINILGSVGAYMLVLYGLLAFVLAIGLMKQEEWAAGGTFVLLLIVLVYDVLSVWGWYSISGTFTLPVIVGAASAVIMLFILIYLIAAKGWK